VTSRLHAAPFHGPNRPQHLRRYGWLRLYSDFPTHPKWRAIALQAAVPVAEVVAIATMMLCKANIGRPRGSLADFSVFECAAALDIEPERVARAYAALEDRGWIDQEYLATWDERQPDREDPTVAERVRRHRRKKKVKMEAERRIEEAVGVTRYTVTETPRQDENIEKEKEPSEGRAVTIEPQKLVPRNSGDSGEKPLPELWLETEGLAIVIDRLQCQAPLARVRLDGWRRLLSDDAALMGIIWAAAQPDRKRALFAIIVRDGISRRLQDARGPQLPLPPVILRKTGEG
jgi:hypothetical protein